MKTPAVIYVAVLSAILAISASGCRPAAPAPVSSPTPPSNTYALNPVRAQDVVKVIKIFKVKPPFPPSGEWVRVANPSPHPASVQEVFSQNEKMYVGIRINPEYTANVTFSKYAFFNAKNSREEEINHPIEKGPFQLGQTILLAFTNPWTVPNETGVYEFRIYHDNEVAASAVFEVIRIPVNSVPTPNLLEYPHRVSLEEANKLVKANLPVPAYVPENFSLTAIYYVEHTDANQEFVITFYPKGGEDGGITKRDEAPIRMYIGLLRGGQIGGLKLVGEEYTIGGTRGILLTRDRSNDLWWIINYHGFPGQYAMRLSANKDIPKEELVKMARSVPQTGWSR